jgi:beta-mannosidase
MSILLKRSVFAVVVSLVAPFLAVGGQAGNPVAGRFGNGVVVTNKAYVSVKSLEEYKAVPFTVELWCKLNSVDGINVLVSNEPQESDTHWELFTSQSNGNLRASLGFRHPIDLVSSGNVADGQWHYVGMTVATNKVALYVDGREAARAAGQPFIGGMTKDGFLNVGKGRSAVRGFGCDGFIDELRISSGHRAINGIPSEPFKPDAATVGLWHFDEPTGIRGYKDASSQAVLLAGQWPSMSDSDSVRYKAGDSPLVSPALEITLEKGSASIPAVSKPYSLDGEWQLLEGSNLEVNAESAWDKAIKAPVPGSVHTALFKAGMIADPFVGTNQNLTAPWSKKTYYYRKVFPRPPAGQDETLVFDGICNRCTIWLNGQEIGKHEGMFDPVELPVKSLLKDSNILVVKLDPALDWKKTVVFNNSYGWHYSKFPPLGIWQSVKVRGEPSVKMEWPFIATRDVKTGAMDLVIAFKGAEKGWAGRLTAVIAPDNFKGETYRFTRDLESGAAGKEVHYRFTVPDPKLWWPVDIGEPNLYRLKLAFEPKDRGGRADVQDICFGIRTIEMAPANGKSKPFLFDWTFVINGRPMFVKGTGWCTPDAMMDFSRARYERFIRMAVSQHIQMLRAWGMGMVETEDFYDLCNRSGVMVMQEWPTGGNSHRSQPFDLLERTVRYNTQRLRNHPALVIYTGGNESSRPFGPAIDMMGRLNMELDGTREFHRGEAWGGSSHNYRVYWWGEPLDKIYPISSIFFGEFGLASYPGYESVQRFLPEDEKNLWPAPTNGTFAFHTPIFNTRQDLQNLTRLSQSFTEGKTMERFIVGSQLAQAMGVRAVLERMRTQWPDSTGALYYKLNDNCPAASWATVDWYGAPKIGHYLIQDSFSPLVAVAIFDTASSYEKALTVPVYLLDDADSLNGAKWEVVVRAYGSDLKQIKDAKFCGEGSIQRVRKLGDFSLDAAQTKTSPLFMVLDVTRGGNLVQRNYTFINYEQVKDSLFSLSATTLEMTIKHKTVTVKNIGRLPAVGVNIGRPGHLDTFTVSDNYFWLDAGEAKTVDVNHAEGFSVEAWNVGKK